MKWPRMRTVIVLILLGAVVNVIVAWSCAIWSPLNDVAPTNGEKPQWDRPVPDSWPDHPQTWMQFTGLGVTQTVAGSIVSDAPLLNSQTKDYGQAVITAGFPLKCFIAEASGGGTYEYETSLKERVVGRMLVGIGQIMELEEKHHIPDWIPWQRTAEGFSILPRRPIVEPFLVNSLVFAAAMWSPFWCVAAVRQFRRWNRARHDRCPKCSYPIGVSPVCTECGEPLNRISR